MTFRYGFQIWLSDMAFVLDVRGNFEEQVQLGPVRRREPARAAEDA